MESAVRSAEFPVKYTREDVLSGMTLLTIRGAVKSHPGKRYTLNLS